VRLLLFASPHAVIPVDQALCRVALRLGLTQSRGGPRRLVRETRRALSVGVPANPEARRQAVLYLSHHAQSTCVEGTPHCNVCPLKDGCNYAKAPRS
jgi:endonuclease III